MRDKPEDTTIDESLRARYSPEQRIKKLNDAYDGALDWLASCIEARKPSGTGAAVHVLRSTREEITALENNGVSQRDMSVSFDIPGLDFSGYNAEQKRDA